MKKIIPTLALFYSLISFSQNETPVTTAKPTFGTIVIEQNDKNAKSPTKQESAFGLAIEKATAAFLSKDYEACIEYYKKSRALNFYDPVFEYYVGISYYELWKKTALKKHRNKARKFLKRSKMYGFKDAELFLVDNFN